MRVTLTTLTVLFTLCCATHAAKVTVDPNTVKAAPDASARPDERLSRKITYQSADKRLYSVIDDLSRMTGVVIRCGRSKDDWQVRDLPLVVCAKDVPLGALLKSMASATHLLFSSYKSEDGTRTYRIWRDASREQQIADYFEKRKQAALAKAHWEWDAWAAFGALPDSVLQADPPKTSENESKSVNRVREFGEVIAGLSTAQREAVFSGERLRLKVGKLSPAAAAPIESMYREWHESYRQDQIKLSQEHPEFKAPDMILTDADVKAATLSIYLTSGQYPRLHTVLEGPAGMQSPIVDGFPEWARKYVKKLPDPPTDPEPPSDGHSTPRPGSISDHPALQAKLKLEAPEDKEKATYASMLAAVSEASGVAVVCEDYLSQKRLDRQPDPSIVCGREVAVGDALSWLGTQTSWRYDKENKIATGSVLSWWTIHARLAPEAVLTNLKQKLDGDGVELDDAVTIWGLPNGSYYDWILDSRDLSVLAWGCNQVDETFWKLYNSLTPEHKAAAKSESGLSLAKLDPAYLAGVFQAAAEGANKDGDVASAFAAAVRSRPGLEPKVMEAIFRKHPELAGHSDAKEHVDEEELVAELIAEFPELKSLTAIPTDPETISRLTLRIKERGEPVDPKAAPASAKRQYYMVVDGEGLSIHVSGPMYQFPVFSKERAAELERARK